MRAAGTAMYNGILVSLHLLLEARETRPDARPILFVLSDGETQTGYEREEVEALVRAIGIPVYTIGYGSGIGMDELRAVSGLVEAASLKAEEQDISYRIGVPAERAALSAPEVGGHRAPASSRRARNRPPPPLDRKLRRKLRPWELPRRRIVKRRIDACAGIAGADLAPRGGCGRGDAR